MQSDRPVNIFGLRVPGFSAFVLYLLLSLVMVVQGREGDPFFINRPYAMAALGPIIGLWQFLEILDNLSLLRIASLRPPALISAGSVLGVWISGAIATFYITNPRRTRRYAVGCMVVLMGWTLSSQYFRVLFSELLVESVLCYYFLAYADVAIILFVWDVARQMLARVSVQRTPFPASTKGVD